MRAPLVIMIFVVSGMLILLAVYSQIGIPEKPVGMQPVAGGYGKAAAGGYGKPAAGGYGRPPAGGYGRPPAGGYGRPPMSIKGAVGESLAQQMNDILISGPSEQNWQIKADEVYEWIQAGKDDFLVVDVRPNPEEYTEGHIPGSIAIPYYDLLKTENLSKLPRDKKIILVCVTGQTQNLPIVPLRVLGFDARTMSFGHAAWIKGYWAGDVMQGVIDGAATENYPVEK